MAEAKISKRDQARQWFEDCPRETWRDPGTTQLVTEATGINPREACRIRQELETDQLKPSGRIITAPHVYVPKTVERWALFADEHHPYGDEEAQGIAHEYAATKGVDGIVLQGDFCDFFRVSHWKNDPLRMPFHEEVDLCDKALKQLAGMFKDSRKVFIQGNHELRMQQYLWTAAQEIAGLSSLQVAELLRLGLHGFEFVDNVKLLNEYKAPFALGKLNILHGHEVRVSFGGVYLARTYYLKCGVNVAVAHHHQVQEFITRKLTGEHEGGWSVGCLCNLSEQYAPVTNWCNGFALVDVYPDGTFEMQNKKIINGRVL